MIKNIVLSFFLLTSFCIAQEETLQAGIKYTEASARIEAFDNVQNKMPKDFYRDFLKDPNYEENKKMIEEKKLTLENQRSLCPFYLKKILISYAVAYNDEQTIVPYYNALGSLIRFDVISNTDYPRKIYGYSRYGNLLSVALEISNEEQFVYNENGKLIAHWQNNEMKDKEGKIPKILKLTRETN
ncbi:MAG: hypothetical protein IJ003_05200 [Candidatus Gastranaerophilales bacterium]|nr:hypothetical protein [Candidatus Gastranaerophilales bacterium]